MNDAIGRAAVYTRDAAKHLLAAALLGFCGGVVGAAFVLCMEWVTAFRTAHPWTLLLLPVGAAAIVLLYRVLRLSPETGTNRVIETVRRQERIPVALLPAIFLGTVLTQFVGGSAGKEGAALQLGGSIASGLQRVFRIPEEEQPLWICCGMAAVFSAVFGTPVAAAVFVLEVVDVGRFRYAALAPCLTASFCAFFLSRLLGMEPTRLFIVFDGAATPVCGLQGAALGLLCGGLSILFCLAIHTLGHKAAAWAGNPYLRAVAGGVILLGLTWLSGSQTYNGAGLSVIAQAVGGGGVAWYAFAAKLLFTAVTLACGYKGGEIVPAFFVGAAFGAVAGPLLGLDASLAAALGMIAVFSGAVNCPIAAVVLSVEVFGADYLMPMTAAASLAYVSSAYFGLYSSQRILYSKVGPERIDMQTKG
ncbi:MAG: chloride channel protein [Oscillospiraceae bacterium]|nr:chloride channel protein [Oscillospiraceae bacterium]